MAQFKVFNQQQWQERQLFILIFSTTIRTWVNFFIFNIAIGIWSIKLGLEKFIYNLFKSVTFELI